MYIYFIVLYCIIFFMYRRAPRLALAATWVIQSLQDKYIYIYTVAQGTVDYDACPTLCRHGMLPCLFSVIHFSHML